VLARSGSFVRLDPAGRPLDAQPVRNAMVGTTSIAALSSGRALTFSESGAAILDAPSLQPVARVGGTLALSDQTRPHVAYSGKNFLVTWREGWTILAARVALDGTPLDGAGFHFQAGFQTDSDVVFDGVNYVVAWTVSNRAMVARISPDGAVLDPNGVALPDVAAFGTPALWTDGRNTLLAATTPFGKGGLNAFLLDRSLHVIGSAAVMGPRVYPRNISIAWDGREWLIAYEDFPPQIAGHEHSQVAAARLTGSMIPMDPRPLTISDPSRGWSFDARAVWDGGEFTVFWNDFDNLYARHVRTDGNVGPQITLATDAYVADAAWDGERYALLIGQPRTLRPRGTHFDLMLRHIGPTLNAFEDSVRLAVADEREFYPDPWSVDLLLLGKRAIAVYQRQMNDPFYGSVMRAFIREAIQPPPRTRPAREP
jgi:hypothetical protein